MNITIDVCTKNPLINIIFTGRLTTANCSACNRYGRTYIINIYGIHPEHVTLCRECFIDIHWLSNNSLGNYDKK